MSWWDEDRIAQTDWWADLTNSDSIAGYVRAPTPRQLRQPFRFLYRERNTIAFGVFLAAFIWALLMWVS
ncbi:MAG: hypothetical protein WA695_01290 [Candidatus Dormiibacterota bacterium]